MGIIKHKEKRFKSLKHVVKLTENSPNAAWVTNRSCSQLHAASNRKLKEMLVFDANLKQITKYFNISNT